MKANPGVDLGVRVSPSLKETLMRQAETEKRSLRTVVETILESAVTKPQAIDCGVVRS